MKRLNNYIIYLFAAVAILHFAAYDASAGDLEDYNGMDGHLQAAIIVQTNEPLELLKECSFTNKHQQIVSDSQHTRRLKMLTHISFDINRRDFFLLITPVDYFFVAHIMVQHPEYKYLFFSEINPPPPKSCS